MRSTILRVSAFALLILAVLYLSVQNRNLREHYLLAAEKVELPYVGMFVPEVSLVDTSGHHVLLGAPQSGKQLLYVFNAYCPYCAASLPALTRIWNLLSDSRTVELVALSHNSEEVTANYLKEAGLDMPFISVEERRTLALFHATSVPLLMLINGDGQVEYMFAGQLNMEDVEHVVAAASSTDAGYSQIPSL